MEVSRFSHTGVVAAGGTMSVRCTSFTGGGHTLCRHCRSYVNLQLLHVRKTYSQALYSTEESSMRNRVCVQTAATSQRWTGAPACLLQPLSSVLVCRILLPCRRLKQRAQRFCVALAVHQMQSWTATGWSTTWVIVLP